VCDTCDEVCPQNIELTEIFTLLKNQSVANGNAPEFIYSQARAIFEGGKAIPISHTGKDPIARRREQLGLPPVADPDVYEFQTLLKNLGVDKKLK
jgi:heterodisulfide reductase subunit C